MGKPARDNRFEAENTKNTGEDKAIQLSAGVSQFVENMGMIMERYGIARIGGRIMGLFMVNDDPLSLDEIAQLLNVSRASVSTNLRISEMSGMAARVSLPGDRRDYYAGTKDMWIQGIKISKQDGVAQIAVAARTAIAKVPEDDHIAHERLQEIIDFAEFFISRFDQLIEDWKVYKADKAIERYTHQEQPG